MQVSEHAKLRISQRVPNIGRERPIDLFDKVIRYGKNITEFYGEYRVYLNNLYTKNRGKLAIKIYGGVIYLYENKKKILITVLNTPQELEPWKDYLKINKNDPIVKERVGNRRLALRESEVSSMNNVSRKDMLDWSDEQLNEWKEKAYNDREHNYLDCKYCGRVKPCTEFSKDNSATNRIGFRPECKKCYKAITSYGGIKKMRNDNITVFDLLGIDESKPVADVKATSIRISQNSVGLKDIILRCKECNDDFIFSYGEQQYYKSHGLFNPSKCPKCREAAKIEAAKIEGVDVASETISTHSSNTDTVIANAKQLLGELKKYNITLDQLKGMVEIYNGCNEFVLGIVKAFEDLVVSQDE